MVILIVWLLVLQVRLSDGRIIWKTYTAPDNKNQTGGFSGECFNTRSLKEIDVIIDTAMLDSHLHLVG
jgi:hypothetical protein